MEKRIGLVTKIGRILTVTLLLGLVGQLALPVVAQASRSKCVSMPLPRKPGTSIINCSTERP